MFCFLSSVQREEEEEEGGGGGKVLDINSDIATLLLDYFILFSAVSVIRHRRGIEDTTNT